MRDLDEPKLWAVLCERFHDIRQRAYAFGLEGTWRGLAEAGPEAPGSLAGWLGLLHEVERLDEGQTDWGVRYGEDDDASDDAAGDGEDDDWWDGWSESGERFGCPSKRCVRTASHGLMPPRCWLSDRPMDPVEDGGSPGGRPD
jgi:hypothetical protein